MADFRKVLVALAVLVFVAGMANAQNFSCNQAAGAVTPQIRSEGLTELIGDLVLDCTGTGPIGLVNFTVYTDQGEPITSRVGAGQSGVSEALLIIDDAGAPGRPTPAVAPSTTGCTGTAADACTYNVFPGVVAVPNAAAPSVTFLGIPIVPPGTNHRLIRITNVRINAAALGVTSGRLNITATLSISPPTSVPIPNATFTVGIVTPSLAFDGLVNSGGSADTPFSFRQCEGVEDPDIPQTYLQFRELFATAFKPRGLTGQNSPGTFYNTESGLQIAGAPVSARANWGTRLRATFSNIPIGTQVWVACQNEAIADNNANISAVTGAALLHGGTLTQSFSAATCTNGYAQVVNSTSATTNSGTAVWEVRPDIVQLVDPGTTIPENFDFGVYFIAPPNPQATPQTGVTGRVAGNYAPTPSSSQLATWPYAMTGTIPRFLSTGNAVDLITFTICQTNLLYPYVLGGVAGFDTGIAITNTSTDPWDTTPQSGTCKLNFYGANAPAAFTTPSIGLKTTDFGTIWASTAMSLASGFNGYIIAQCNFQYAHGFAFVSDIGAHNIAMGYLALILPDVEGIGFRPVNGISSLATAESLSN